MAITLDATSNSGYQAASASYSWVHTIGASSNQILVISVGLLSVTNSVTGITYNNIALTKLRADVSVSTTVRTEIWYLVAPATGSNTVAVTLNTASVSGSSATSYNGVDQASPTDAQNGGTGITGAGGGSASIATTTVTNNAWVVDAVATADTTITVGSGQTQEANISGAVGSLGQSDKGPNTPAGSVTMQWDNIAGLTTWTMSTMALKPLGGTAALTDSGTITESLAHYSDQVDVNESTLLALVSNPNKSENITISESVGQMLESNRSISDNITLSESFLVSPPSESINPNDTVTLTESIAVSVQTTDSIAESISISELVQISINNLINKSDSVTISENNNQFVPFLDISVSENTTVTENQAISTPAYMVVVSDFIGRRTSSAIIFLTDGQIAARLSNNLYQPL